MRRETVRSLYGLFIAVLLLVLGIAYAQVLSGTLEVQGEAEVKAQQGIFITEVEYYADNGADTANSKANFFTSTTLNSTVTLGANAGSTYTYKVTMYNGTDREQVFIGAITNKGEPSQYSNTNIDYDVNSVTGLNGLTEYVTTIAPGDYLTFPVTFKYTGSDVSNRTLTSYINFRFREKPVLELSNDGETYTLENIYAGHEEEYEFTVSNYNKNYNNTVPMTYSFETTLTEGSPLEAKIYDENGAEVTGNISELGDGTPVDRTYKLKLTWDESKNGAEYRGEEYTCNVKLNAVPDDTDYAEYVIEKSFNIDITTQNAIPISTVDQLLKIGSNEVVTINGKSYTLSSDANYELQNDITFEIDDYIEEYPDAFEGRTITVENEITNYETANSDSNQYYTFTAPSTWDYKLEVWGAQGGSYDSTYYGGKGGYSVGTVSLEQGEEIYVFVGSQPTTYNTSATSENTNAGGYNGGGTGRTYAYSGTTTYALGGGGATDMRIGGTSYYDRVIVAGGGSGSTNWGTGYAGGGQESEGYNANYVASQTLAGDRGTFGTGGSSAGKYNYKYGPPGGGGGWYGGGCRTGQSDYSGTYEFMSGGGSGFVWTEGTASNVPTGYLVGTKYYLTNAATYAGNTEFASTAGATEIGHSGDGYARITLISGLKDTTAWKDAETQIENGALTGEFSYNGHTITVGNKTYPSIPTVTAEVEDITTSGATITATGKDPAGKTLQYTLLLNDTIVSGPSETKEWTINNLYDNTSYTYTVEVTNGKYTGETTVEFTTEELTVTAETSDITTTTAKITATGTEAGGDTLQYTLKINGENYGPSTTKEWNVTNLADNTTHSYTVEVTDGTNTESYTGSLKTKCIHNFEGNEAPEGAGTKFTETGTYSDGTNTAKIPAGFTVSGAGGKCTFCGELLPTTEYIINEGLVIYLIQDKTDAQIADINWNDATTLANLKKTYDQFVWIPMPKENINDMYMCQSETGSKTCKIGLNSSGQAYCSTHSSTAMAGRLYATTIFENYTPTLTTQTYTANSGVREPDTVSSYDGDTSYLGQLNGVLGTSYSTAANLKTDLQSEYNEIVKSVYENEGFYIGRYETSGMVDSDTNVTVKIVAGSDNSTNANISGVTWYRMYAQQKKYASNKGLTGSIGSTMIQGAAYDQVMKFIDPTTSFVKTTGKVGHSSYYFTSTPYQTGGLNYSSLYIGIGTGTYNDVAKNIYDLEGNVCVSTTEARNTNFRVIRGGYYSYNGSPSVRLNGGPLDSSNGDGSVCQLYIHDEHTYVNGVCGCGEK